MEALSIASRLALKAALRQNCINKLCYIASKNRLFSEHRGKHCMNGLLMLHYKWCSLKGLRCSSELDTKLSRQCQVR